MAANSRFAVATHIMTSLAVHKDEWLSSKYLASSVNTNPVVIRRILIDLQKAALIQTTAGKTGGAQIAKKTSAITLFDIYKAVSDLSVFAFNNNDPNKNCPLSCAMKSVLEPVFKSANDALTEDLKKVKIADLVQQLNQQIDKKNVKNK